MRRCGVTPQVLVAGKLRSAAYLRTYFFSL